MLTTLNRTTSNNTYKNYYSTGYSSLPFQQKTLSQIKRENQQSRQSNRKYIETMYRSGNSFAYDLNRPHPGTHRSHLGNLEERTRAMIPELDFEKNRLMIFNTQCINLRNDQKNDYNNLRREMLDEVDNLQIKFTQNLNRQKIENNKNNMEIKQIKNDLLDTKNLVCELKDRVNALKLRIDGTKMYNSDGMPVLETKNELL